MGKIGIILDQQKQAVKDIVKRYLLTLISVNIYCLIEIAVTATKNYGDDTINNIFLFLVLFATGSFFTETVLSKDGSNRSRLIAPYTIFAVLSLVLDILLDMSKSFGKIARENLDKIAVLYIVLGVGLSFHRIIKESGMSFSKYAVNFVFGTIKVAGVLLVLNLGILLLITIFDQLIYSIGSWNFLVYVECILAGVVYAPYMLICLTDKKAENSKFTRGFLLYALMPMTFMAILIIYMYIMKIIFTLQMPENEVFNICAVLFVVGVVIWSMSYAFVEDDVEGGTKAAVTYKKMIKYAKYIYAPFIIIELLAIGIRIGNYGWTTERYYGVVFVIFQIIYVFWEFLYGFYLKCRNREKNNYADGYEHLIYVVIAMYVICVLLPFISAERVEYLSQKRRYEKYMAGQQIKEMNLSRESRSELYSIQNTLMWNTYGEKYLKKKYSEKELKWLSYYFENGYYADEYDWEDEYDAVGYDEWENLGEQTPSPSPNNYERYYKSSGRDVKVTGYDYSFYIEEYLPRGTVVEISYGEGWLLTVDCSNVIKKIIQEQDYGSGPYEIVIDADRKLVLTTVSFLYYTNGDIEGLDIYGYLLVKEGGYYGNE